MTASFANWDEHTLDLAIDRFTVGLDSRAAARLDQLAEGADLREFENALAAIHLASLVDVQAPPSDVLHRIERAGRQHVANTSAAAEPERGTLTPLPSRLTSAAGWLVAAALLLSFFLFQPKAEIDPAQRRSALIASAEDLTRLDWTATDDPAARGASGDVVWSSSMQEGYMRFVNLAPNTPQENQYQLWIFDPTRADWEAKPVDGGVFDVPEGSDVVVPIDAKLGVRDTALFAVTIEVPGGVVVSERERLVLTAAL